MKIGMIAMAAKPYHIGHDALIRIAASENDRVNVFVGTGDRSRSGEFPVSGQAMLDIWLKYISKTLPQNVWVHYVKAPLRNLFNTVGVINELHDRSLIVNIYGDSTDIARQFPPNTLKKYFNQMYSQGRLRLRPIPRKMTVNISGTKMREWLSNGKKNQFINALPRTLRKNGEDIWKTLTEDL